MPFRATNAASRSTIIRMREDGRHSKANCTSSGFESHSTGWEGSIWGIPAQTSDTLPAMTSDTDQLPRQRCARMRSRRNPTATDSLAAPKSHGQTEHAIEPPNRRTGARTSSTYRCFEPAILGIRLAQDRTIRYASRTASIRPTFHGDLPTSKFIATLARQRLIRRLRFLPSILKHSAGMLKKWSEFRQSLELAKMSISPSTILLQLALLSLLVPTPASSANETMLGIVVAPEDRCSPYDRQEYAYPRHVKLQVVESLGSIFSPYTGQYFTNVRDTDLDHIVALSEAHDSGLCAADPDTRRSFSVDLLNLTLAPPRLNRSQKWATMPHYGYQKLINVGLHSALLM